MLTPLISHSDGCININTHQTHTCSKDYDSLVMVTDDKTFSSSETNISPFVRAGQFKSRLSLILHV